MGNKKKFKSIPENKVSIECGRDCESYLAGEIYFSNSEVKNVPGYFCNNACKHYAQCLTKYSMSIMNNVTCNITGICLGIELTEKEKDLFVKESCGRAHNTLIEIVNTEKSDACNNAQKQRNIVVKILIKKYPYISKNIKEKLNGFDTEAIHKLLEEYEKNPPKRKWWVFKQK